MDNRDYSPSALTADTRVSVQLLPLDFIETGLKVKSHFFMPKSKAIAFGFYRNWTKSKNHFFMPKSKAVAIGFHRHWTTSKKPLFHAKK